MHNDAKKKKRLILQYDMNNHNYHFQVKIEKMSWQFKSITKIVFVDITIKCVCLYVDLWQ